MPNLPNNVPVYEPNQPYYYTFDNTPIDALIQRDNIINTQVDLNTQVLEDAGGSAGSLPVRLNQSMDEYGNLTTLAVNTAMHNIGYHEDGVGPDYISYVRMTAEERAKLASVDENATNVTIGVRVGPTFSASAVYPNVQFDNGQVTFVPSATVNWSVQNGQEIVANVVAQPDGHVHYDNVTPVNANASPDYINYLTGISATFETNSLKVFINGVRIFPSNLVYVPTSDPTDPWVQNKFTPTSTKTGFALNTAITAADVIIIDFRVSAS
jgi:hypothetical protein